jgi:drug/metabolite transporter (DMT)-like permease
MTVITAFAGFFLKMSSADKTIFGILKNKYLYIGCLLYVGGAPVNIWLLQRMSYSILIPMGGICYIWTLLISHIFLHEKIGIPKITGIGCIVLGVFLMSLSI